MGKKALWEEYCAGVLANGVPEAGKHNFLLNNGYKRNGPGPYFFPLWYNHLRP